MMDIKEVLFINFFDEKNAGICIISNQQAAKELAE